MVGHMRALLIVAVGVVGLAAPLAQTPAPYDVLITGGRLVDGTGAPWFRADVAIAGDRIAAIGDLAGAPANARVEAANLVVAPGFIDMLGQSEFNVLVDGRAASKIMMGVTTEITGEGGSIAPVNARMIAQDKAQWDHYGLTQDFQTLAGYFTRLETRSKPAINLGSFVGAGGVRDYVIGRGELARQRGTAGRDEAAGRAGDGGRRARPEHVASVRARSLRDHRRGHRARQGGTRSHGGVYLTHQRSESGQIFESIDEVIRISRDARIPAEIWHLKTAYKANWGKMPEVLARIRAARASGIDVTANQYPYTRASNGLDACLPLWVREGGTDAMIARLQDPGHTRADQARNGRPEREGLGEPVVRLRRRRRRDGVRGAQSGPAQVGRA